MPLRVVFDLEDKDLEYFKASMQRARKSAESASEDEIIGSALAMIEQVSTPATPAFVQQRLERLSRLIDMLRDEEWPLAQEERGDILTALSYFADPEDIIPDNVPVLGYIDDAIMIELVVKELRHEIDAFEDFSRFRAGELARKRDDKVSREDYLDHKRRDLQQRMRRRRTTMRRASKGTTRPRFRLF